MKNKYNPLYPFKVWILTLLLGPLPTIDEYNLQSYSSMFFFSVLFSIPTLTITFLTFLYLRKTIYLPGLLKAFLILLGTILFTITLLILRIPFFGSELVHIPLAYIFIFSLISILIKIQKTNKTQLLGT